MLFNRKKLKQEIEDLKLKHHNEITHYINEIDTFKLMLSESKKLNEDILKLLEQYNRKTEKYLINYVEHKKYDIDAFFTTEYRAQFESFINDENHTNEEILDKFNELYNEENAYFEGIASCINFIRTKRNPKISTEKQIIKHILTEQGRRTLDSYIESITLNSNKEIS